jgi:hypothetical protein
MAFASSETGAFARLMEPVAKRLLGDPNPHLSSATELRFGSHGSLSVDLVQGVWSDHEAKEGGGVLDLLKRELKLEGKAAIEWLNREVGGEFEDRRQPQEKRGEVRPLKRIVATYDYVDERGELIFQTVRFEPKTFSQRRPDPDSPGAWVWSVKGVRQVPYRLPEVLDAVATGRTIYIVEGEKDADALAREGLAATCNAMGAGKWPEEIGPALQGADVVILPDNDEAGANHTIVVASALRGIAKRIRVLDLPELPPKGDVSDWLAAGGDAEQLAQLVEASAEPWKPETPKSAFGAIRWADIDAVKIRQDFLVEDIMFCGDIGMFYGASGSGKSFLAVHMGLCIARGVDFLGKRTRKGAVIYQAGEGGKGLLKRLRAYKQENRVFDEDVPFILLPSRVDLFSADGDTEAFIAECLAWRAALQDPLAAIVIDTFSTASPGANENASEDVSRLITAGEAINRATGAALFWVHHKNAAGDRERGHTSLRANIDTAIEVVKEEDTSVRTMRLSKMKDGEDGLKLGFELHPVEIGSYDDGKPMTSCVVVPAQLGSDRPGKRPRLPNGQFNFLKVLDSAISQRGGVVPGVGCYGVEYEAFRDLYVTLLGSGKASAAIRQAISRDGDALWRAGLIERQDPWLWITDKGAQSLC